MNRLTILLLVYVLSLPVGCSTGGGEPREYIVQVVAEPAAHQPVSDTVSLVGTLLANEAVDIQSEIDGTVEHVGFQEGDFVKKGDVLFKIDESKLALQVAEAEANFELAKANLKRSSSLYKNKTISSQEYDQTRSTHDAAQAALNLARQRLADATLTAPFDGVMGSRLVSPGQRVSAGFMLCSIVSLDPIKVELNVPERFFGKLAKGLRTEVSVAPYEGEVFDGEVYFVSPKVETNTRTVLVKARIANPDAKLRPGMFANVDLVLSTRKKAVVVPENAVVLMGDKASVFVVSKEGTADLRTVELGQQLKGAVEIQSGVAAGELVVVEGVQKIGPGVKLAVTPGPDEAVAHGG